MEYLNVQVLEHCATIVLRMVKLRVWPFICVREKRREVTVRKIISYSHPGGLKACQNHPLPEDVDLSSDTQW